MHYLRDSTQIAKKDYHCDGCDLMFNYGNIDQIINDFNLSVSEIESLLEAKKYNYKIINGEKYYKQINVDAGYLFVCRVRYDIHQILIKYKFYSEY